MKTKIQKWGNSLGVRLPKNITHQKDLREGAGVSIVIKNDQIVIEPVRKEVSLSSLLSKITDENTHEATKWGTARGNEVW